MKFDKLVETKFFIFFLDRPFEVNLVVSDLLSEQGQRASLELDLLWSYELLLGEGRLELLLKLSP